jgi:PAS domain S-box-containing protein
MVVMAATRFFFQSRSHNLDVPFIIVSGTIDLTTAVQAMRAGVHDFVLKDDLERLLPAVAREVREAEVREAHRQAVQKLRASETRCQDLYENAPDIFVSVEPTSGTVVECNETLVSVTGYARRELLGRPILDLYHPASKEAVRELYHVVEGAGGVRNAELQLRCKDGRVLDVSVNVATVRDETGTLRGRSVVHDITRCKLVERRLRETEGRFRELAENIREVIWMTDVKREQVLYVSPAFEQVWGRRQTRNSMTQAMYQQSTLPRLRQVLLIKAQVACQSTARTEGALSTGTSRVIGQRAKTRAYDRAPAQHVGNPIAPPARRQRREGPPGRVASP